MIFYATEHDNDGPDETVKMGEWRHKDIVRDGSPTLLPTVAVHGPYDVDEGSSVALDGSAGSPTTRAFIQLFNGVDYGGFYPVVDFDDYDRDDFDDFSVLEPYRGVINFDYNDQAESWKWYAPVGCSIQAINHLSESADEIRTLVGTGLVERAPDLTDVYNDDGTANMNLKTDTVRFLGCDTYYATPVALQWDLDANGSYETTGTAVTFDAGALDGPSSVQVPAQAQHPSGGSVGLASATINVRNVAPALSQFDLVDGGGNQVNTAIPFVLVGMPATAHALFGDPGLPDHQTATLNWGDGQVDSQSSFALFDEAFGDGTGELSQTHRYTLPGTFAIALAVQDDDGGESNQAANIRVVTPKQAVEEVLASLDDLIAQTTDPAVRAILEHR